MCKNVLYKADRGDIKNGERKHCSKNCSNARLSIEKHTDPGRRRIWAQARHRARAVIYKMNIKPMELPAELFVVLVRSYVAKEIMKRTVLK